MGAMLSNPVELIQVQRSGNQYYRAAAAEMQGWRNSHEDAHNMCCEDSIGSFWVLDGHGGEACAKFCSPKLGEEFVKAPMVENERIEKSFSEIDDRFCAFDKEGTASDAGSTVVGCITQQEADGSYTVKLVNCGDSRALLVMGPDADEKSEPLEVRLPQHLVDLGSRSSGCKAPASESCETDYKMPNKDGNPCFSCRWPLIAESVDHKPNHPTEKCRIEAAGGFVTKAEPCHRVDGQLAVSRGLGDLSYKADNQLTAAEQKVSCVPDIYEVRNVPAGSFIVLACDGVWDVCTGEFVANWVREELQNNPGCDIGELTAKLIRISLEKNSKDNITCMIIQLADGSDFKCISDEMKGWEKLRASEKQTDALDEETKRIYKSFLRRCSFPEEPVPCSLCNRWQREMSQCPCKTAFYCCRPCQKKDWKEHKASCPAINGSMEEPEAEQSPEGP